MNQIKRHTDTRWYSTSTMIKSLLQAKSVIVEEAQQLQDCQLEADLSDESKWSALEALTEVFYPLAECIGQAERSTGSLGEAVKATLEFGRKLLASDRHNPVIVAATGAYLVYFSTKKLGAEFGLLIAPYSLDRRYKLDYLTQDSIDQALTVILDIGLKDKTCAINARLLVSEFESYCSMAGEYNESAENLSAFAWWSKRTDGPLKYIALRIAKLRSSSADIERTFSSLKYVQGSWRKRLSLVTMTDMVRLRLLAHRDNHEKADDYSAIRTEDLIAGDTIVQQTTASGLNDLEGDSGSPLSLNTEALQVGLVSLARWFDFTKTTTIASADLSHDGSSGSIEELVRESRRARESSVASQCSNSAS